MAENGGRESLVDAAQVERASERIRGHVRVTPVLEVLEVWNDATRPVLLKLELLQVTGTFKARGAYNRLLGARPPDSGVIAASGGNHGIAVAYAGRRLGLPVEIFVPRTSSPVKVARLRALGATVHQIGDAYADALAAMRERQAASGALEVHAYDHPEVVAGQGTMTRELIAQAPQVDTVVIAVGGGGLIAGALACAGGRKRIVAVEPVTSCALNAALRAGAPLDVSVSGVAADSLGARRIGDICFELAKRHDLESVLVDDQQILAAQRWLWSNCRLVAEPGGATALAAL
ncbi:MAG: threonine/serine dehydratase, partial [Gammaproteobacteria bacterium]|nr:threonine/serine dehydratase [Gammaproteobacteria bacterium]